MSDVAIFGQMPSESGWKALLERCKTPEKAEKIAAIEACKGHVGRILAELAGGKFDCVRVNLNRRWHSAFDETEACITASAILTEFPNIKRVICLGRAVGAIMGFGKRAELLRVMRYDDRAYLLFPHPSGRNLWFNNPENREKAAAALRKFLE